MESEKVKYTVILINTNFNVKNNKFSFFDSPFYKKQLFLTN